MIPCHSTSTLRRLYSQAENMCKHYRIPILLIEFDDSKQWGLTVRVL